jgi:TPR repeat protein
MGKLWGVLVSVLFIAAGCEGASTSPVLSESEFNRLSLEAMAGSVEAAERIVLYYRWEASDSWYADRLSITEWAMIGAENGSREEQYHTAGFLSQQVHTASSYEIPRCVFWMRLAAKNGDDRLKDSLENNGLSLDFDFPPDSSFPDSYIGMSAGIIVACEEGALKGSGKAALLLAKYYGNTVKDRDLAAYWYRIGAQNGDPECQYNFGSIYAEKYGQLNRTRCYFWQQKAVENGITP